MKPIVNHSKYNANNDMKERAISNFKEEKEDEKILRLREALLKKEEIIRKKNFIETGSNINTKNNQVFK